MILIDDYISYNDIIYITQESLDYSVKEYIKYYNLLYETEKIDDIDMSNDMKILIATNNKIKMNIVSKVDYNKILKTKKAS